MSYYYHEPNDYKPPKSKFPKFVGGLSVLVLAGVIGVSLSEPKPAPVPQMSVQEAIQMVEGGGANVPTATQPTVEAVVGEDVVAVIPGGNDVKAEVTVEPTQPVTEPATEAQTEVVMEVETEPVTEVVTEVVTEPATEMVTEAATEPVTEAVVETPTEQQTQIATKDERVYIGNSNTKKFHYQSCSSADEIKPKNRVEITGRDTAINGGYVPCKRCDP